MFPPMEFSSLAFLTRLSLSINLAAQLSPPEKEVPDYFIENSIHLTPISFSIPCSHGIPNDDIDFTY